MFKNIIFLNTSNVSIGADTDLSNVVFINIHRENNPIEILDKDNVTYIGNLCEVGAKQVLPDNVIAYPTTYNAMPNQTEDNAMFGQRDTIRREATDYWLFDSEDAADYLVSNKEQVIATTTAGGITRKSNAGLYGDALNMDGGNGVYFPVTANANANNVFSLWFKADSDEDLNGNTCTLLALRGESNQVIEVTMLDLITHGARVSKNYHHIVIKTKQNNADVYFDGKFLYNEIVTGGISQAYSGYYGSGQTAINGEICEFSYYAGLSEEEATDVFINRLYGGITKASASTTLPVFAEIPPENLDMIATVSSTHKEPVKCLGYNPTIHNYTISVYVEFPEFYKKNDGIFKMKYEVEEFID